MSAAILSMSERAVEELDRGKLKRILIEGVDGIMILYKVRENAILIVSTTTSARLGLIELDSNPQNWSARIAYDKIVSIMKKESVNKLAIERKYLPEIFNDDVLEISIDGLPILKPFALEYFRLRGIKAKPYGNVLKFSLPNLKIMAENEKMRKRRKHEREEQERENEKEERDKLFKLFQNHNKKE